MGGTYLGLNVSVPAKFICWSPAFQCDGGTHMGGISALLGVLTGLAFFLCSRHTMRVGDL